MPPMTDVPPGVGYLHVKSVAALALIWPLAAGFWRLTVWLAALGSTRSLSLPDLQAAADPREPLESPDIGHSNGWRKSAPRSVTNLPLTTNDARRSDAALELVWDVRGGIHPRVMRVDAPPAE
jgi:hypothetical protein